MEIQHFYSPIKAFECFLFYLVFILRQTSLRIVVSGRITSSISGQR